MPLSIAPAAKRALYDALKASSALAGVGVWYSTPNTDHPPNENLIVGPDDTPMTSTQEWATLGPAPNARRAEQIDIPVRIEVLVGGTDEFAAEARTWEIGEELATVLSLQPLRTLGIHQAHPTDFSQVTTAYQDGRVATLSLVVSCTGRLGGL